MSIVVYIAVMAIVTYLIRMLPLTLFRSKIKSKFLRSFLKYIPYTVLSAMTFPAIFYSTGNVITATVGTVAALITAFFGLPLIIVAAAAAGAALIVGLFIL